MIQGTPQRALLSFAPAAIEYHPHAIRNGLSNLSAIAPQHHDRPADCTTVFRRKLQRRLVAESCESLWKVEMFGTTRGQDNGNDFFVICTQGCGRINYATPKHQGVMMSAVRRNMCFALRPWCFRTRMRGPSRRMLTSDVNHRSSSWHQAGRNDCVPSGFLLSPRRFP